MKHKVATIEGAFLDAAVAMAEGMSVQLIDERGCLVLNSPDATHPPYYFRPSEDWSCAGPILERERINLDFDNEFGAGCVATINGDNDARVYLGLHGPTAPIAGMRAFVASKFGEQVELP